MAINKVVINGVTKLDLTADTVTAAALKSGETAHDRGGNLIVGTAVCEVRNEILYVPQGMVSV